MKMSKKLLCLILAMVLLISNIAIIGNVFAQTADTEPLKIEVTTDKTSYTAYGIAEITVNITNISDETVNNVKAEAVFEQLAPVSSKTSETYKEIETLESGENFALSYKATLNTNKVSVSFFEKIIIWFVRLFNGGYNATSHNIEAVTENITQIKFGKYTAENVVNVYYEYSEDEDLIIYTEVFDKINKVKNENNYINLPIEQKVEIIKKILNQLEQQGKIKNITYNSTSNFFHFDFSTFGSGGVVVENTHDNNCFSSTNTIVESNNENRSIIETYSNVSLQTSQNIDSNWLFVFGATEEDNSSKSNIMQIKNEYKELGVNIEFQNDATVETYTNMENKDLIYIMAHGGNVDNNEQPYITTTEIATSEKIKKYKNDIKSGDIELISNAEKVYFWILPSFIENKYTNNELDNAIVLLTCCDAFGSNNKENYRWAEAFKNSGASAVVGFCNSVLQSYACCFYERMIYYICQNYSVRDSFDNACTEIGYNDNDFIKYYATNFEEKDQPAYPILSTQNNDKKYSEDLLSDMGAFSFTVKDELTNEPVEDVSVIIYQLEPDGSQNALIRCYKTDSNGSVLAKLPNGKYYYVYGKENYIDSEECSFEIENNEYVVLLYPIYLKREQIQYRGVVCSDDFFNGIPNVEITIESTEYTNKYSATTNESGTFYMNMPAGSYKVTCTHEDFEAFEKIVNLPIEFDEIRLNKKVIKGNISGNIKDFSNKTPIENATVKFIMASDTNKVYEANSNSDGYFSKQIPSGNYSVTVSKEGYLPRTIQNIVVNGNETTYLSESLMLIPNDARPEISGKVINAISGNSEANVELRFRYNHGNNSGEYITTDGENVLVLVSDENGYYYTDKLPIGYYTIEASKNNFITSTYDVVCVNGATDQNVVISPQLSDGELRVVLRWGNNPRDLDSHLVANLNDGTQYHVYYDDKKGYHNDILSSYLDVDDRNGVGPETTTIYNLNEGTYKFYVHRYDGNGYISTSNAEVKLYQGDNLIATYNVPVDQGNGDYWNVFEYSNGNIRTINTITDSPE